MKKLLLFLLPLLLLTGCAGSVRDGKSRFALFRAQFLEQDGFSLKARISADYGERVYEYLLTYEGNGESGMVTVLEPVELEYVAAQVGKDGVTLYYDGAVLDTGAVAENLSPVQAFPLLVESWRTGCVTDCWQEPLDETDCVAARMDATEAGETDTVWLTTWFAAETGVPVYGEISVNGQRVMAVDFLKTQ